MPGSVLDLDKSLIDECAFKEECTLEEHKERAAELKRCEISFLRFLRWVKVLVPPDPTNPDAPSGLVPLEMWPHVKEIIAAFLTHRLIVVLKARQIGLSTIVAAYVLWLAMFKRGSRILLISKGEDQSIELLEKSKTIYGGLPPFMQFKIDPDSRTEIGFPSNSGRIHALSSKPGASIGYTASVVVYDEHAFHEYADRVFQTAQPTMERQGQVISVSTPDPYDDSTLHNRIFTDALNGKSDFIPLFYGWDVVPERTQDWYDNVMKNIPPAELGSLTPELYMRKNYPATIEEAMSQPETIVVFDKEVIASKLDDCHAPINFKENPDYEDIDNSVINIYKPFHIGNFYVAATDVSLGVGKDYSVTGILNVQTGCFDADIMSHFLAPEELAFHSIKMLELYGSPLWWIEANMWGDTVIKKAQELGYKRLGERAKGKVGFVTGDATRTEILGLYIPAFNNYQITVFNREGLLQHRDIIRNTNRGGFVEAMKPKHDDYVIMAALAWAKKDEVKTDFTTNAIPSLTFGTKWPTSGASQWKRMMEG